MRPQDAVANPPTASARPASHSERTRQPRVGRRMAYRVPCRVRLIDAVTGEVHTVAGETLNLSPQGMALQVGLDVPIGTWVETLVPHSNGDPMFLCGTVVHSRRTMKANFEIGVETSRPDTFV